MHIQPVAPVFAAEEATASEHTADVVNEEEIAEVVEVEVLDRDEEVPEEEPVDTAVEVAEETTTEPEETAEEPAADTDVGVLEEDHSTDSATAVTEVVDSGNEYATSTETEVVPVESQTAVDESEPVATTTEILGVATTTATSTPDTPTEDVSDTSDTPATTGGTDAEIDTATTSASTTESTEVGDDVVPDTGADSEDEMSEEEVTATTEQNSNEEPAQTATTTTATTTVVSHSTAYVTNDSNRYQFGHDDCVSVGDGSFYCSDTQTYNDNTTSQVAYAAPGGDGDTEIYMRTQGGTVAITDNAWADEAPDFDQQSNQLVWHRLVEGRYQIIMYDLATETETQLTNTETNNMEPTVAGEYIVWQRWMVNNWEIMLFDGTDVTQITNNQAHDLAPDIQGGYIIWHTNDAAGERQVVVYEIATGLLSHIADSEGGQVTNPRFVLVYDTTFANGDQITRGFDPETGELVPLAAVPVELPPTIPESDSTGETRALMQYKQSTRENTEGDEELDFSQSTTSNAVATSTDDILVDSEIVATTTDALPLSDFDLIVEPYASTSAQALATGTSTDSVE